MSLNSLRALIEAVARIAAAAVLAALFYFFGVPGVFDSNSSLLARMGRLHEQCLRLKAQNDQNEAFLQNQIEYLDRIHQLGVQIETLDAIVPDEQKSAQMRSMIDAAGAATDVRVGSVEAQKPALREFYVELPFAVHVVGRYDSLFSFFQRLRQGQRIVSISNPSLGPPEHSRGDFRIRPSELVAAQCVVTTYYMRPQLR